MNRAAQGLAECLALAIAALEKRPLSDEAVHAARKALKRARAALRLLRPALGEAAYRAENARLREAGRALAPLRNNASLLAALQALRRRYPAEARRATAGPARLAAELRAQREIARTKLAHARGLERWLAQLRRARERALRRSAGDGDTQRGLRRVYRAGRRAFAHARDEPGPQALHEWRKQVKYLANALGILRARGGAARRAKATAARLGEALGEHHDLSDLAALVPADSGLRALIDRRRREIEARALRRGERLYGERPRQFARSLD